MATLKVELPDEMLTQAIKVFGGEDHLGEAAREWLFGEMKARETYIVSRAASAAKEDEYATAERDWFPAKFKAPDVEAAATSGMES